MAELCADPRPAPHRVPSVLHLCRAQGGRRLEGAGACRVLSESERVELMNRVRAIFGGEAVPCGVIRTSDPNRLIDRPVAFGVRSAVTNDNS